MTKIWIRTAALERAVYGKTKKVIKRNIPGDLSQDDDREDRWGWARGFIINESHSQDESKEDILQKSENGDIKVQVQDRYSSFDQKEITLAASAIKDGDLVMENMYGENDIDDDSGDDDSYDDCDDVDSTSKYPDDLISLTHLHEPSVVYCLRKRYAFDKIYTATGPILIALNPFKNCKSLYSVEVMEKYWQRGETNKEVVTVNKDCSAEKDEKEGDNGLPPHVYSIADNSFRMMMTKLKESKSAEPSGRRRRGAKVSTDSNCNQSILVSGESGAGKTVTTKFIMQYLATLSKRIAQIDQKSMTSNNKKNDIEQLVLQSNPVLESFGNARTIRNDNSSRFGKFIEIQFTESGHLVGAKVQTYLLEKVRLVTQTEGERNYHIFYELMEGLSEDMLDRYFLQDYTIKDFKMTSQSGTFIRRDGVNDYDTYQDLVSAMQTIGFSKEEQSDIIGIACAILHVSNLTFNSLTADECEIDKSNSHLKAAHHLLGLTVDDLNRALCYFSITAGRETHLRSNSKEKAEKGLLALIKATYGAMFAYIVKRVNESITIDHTNAVGKKYNEQNAVSASIGVLDIFGFESFKSNSFEQLCINYCNEALQQQFNLFVLKNEQEEYEREGIKWSFISFPDNQDVLDLIDKKGAGIINILEDQCRAPGTTDKTFINDLYQKLSRHKRFQADYRQVGASKFAIIHYAGVVEYDSEGFLEKNRDDLPKEATELLLSSSNTFLKCLGGIISQPGEIAGRTSGRQKSKSSVGGQFSRQLKDLRSKIDRTSPHYVRCLKPNDELEPDNFDPLVVSDQLRCAGVIEALRVARIGYPQRYSHARFLARYRLLGEEHIRKAKNASRRQKPIEILVQIIASKIDSTKEDKGGNNKVDMVSTGIQAGKSKIFLRRTAFETIERLRSLEMRKSCIKIQSIARRYIFLNDFKETKNATITIQCSIRATIALMTVTRVRRNYKATLIQSTYRKAISERRYTAALLFVLSLQRLHRGRVGRTLYRELDKIRKAIRIQKFLRMTKDFRLFRQMKESTIVIQCAVRCRNANTSLKVLRKTARDLNNTAKERDELKTDNRRLGKSLNDAMMKIAKLNDSKKMDLQRMETKILELEKELGSAKADIETKMIQIKRFEAALNESCKQNEALLNEREVIESQTRDLKETHEEKDTVILNCTADVEKLKEELKVSLFRNGELLENEDKMQEELDNARTEKNFLKQSLQKIGNKLDMSKQNVLNLECEVSERNKIQKIELISVEDAHDSLTKELSAVQQKLEEAQTLNQDHEKVIRQMKEAIASSESALSEQLSVLKGELESAAKRERDQDEAAATEKSAAKDAHDGLTKELSAVQQKLEEAQTLNQDHEKVIRRMKEAMASSESALSEQLSVLNGELEYAAKRERDQDEAAATEKSVAKDAHNSLTKELTILRHSVTDGESLELLNTQLKEKLSDAEVEKKILSEELLDLNVQLEKSIEINDEIEKEVKNLQNQLIANTNPNQLTSSVEDLQSHLDAKKRDYLVILSENEVLRRRLRVPHDFTHAGKEDSSQFFFNFGKEEKIELQGGKTIDAYKEKKDEYIEELEREVTRLNRESEKRATYKKSSASGESTDKDVERLRRKLMESKETSAEEILTLQDEVGRLNNEMSSLKTAEQTTSPSPSPNRNYQNHQVSKLIDSIMSKDDEIRDLRREIAILRDQVDSSTMSMLTESVGPSRFIDDDERSVVSRIFGRGPASRSGRSLSGTENKETHQLRSINETLRHELAVAKKERDDLKETLQEEENRATNELAAFGDALRQVDELRHAAELMSREIHRLKRERDDEVPHDPFEEVNAIPVPDDALKNFELAKNAIGKANTDKKLDNNECGRWGKFRLGKREKSSISLEKGKEKNDDDRSIFSSFF